MGCSSTKMTAVIINENVECQKNDIDAIGMENAFCLYQAIQNNDFHEARRLISSGTNVDCLNYIGGTPLIETCRQRGNSGRKSRRESFVRFLLQQGADANKNDIFGWKAQLYAAENGHKAIARILEEMESRKIKPKTIEDEELSLNVSMSIKTST